MLLSHAFVYILNCCHVEMLQLCVCLHSCSSEVKFMQERGVARLWEVAMYDFLLPRNYVFANEC